MLTALLFLPPTLLLSQAPAAPTPAPSDAPRVPVALDVGQKVRVTTGLRVQTGHYFMQRDGLFHLVLPDGQKGSVPVAALTEVAVPTHSMRTAVLIGGGAGALLGGALAGGYAGVAKAVGESDQTISVPRYAGFGALTGAAFGALIGVLVGSTYPDWKPVYVRPEADTQRPPR
ncbi:hypothetical protein FGE12_05340 [Aggregicoccus sp. 17bor-14]|uniref:hypothetical protein n=1 Tax=Myxococcaceae TaxID=31 RepID=UPI00129C4393|nr:MULTISPECIES: hypothetical protein [Myxococcaceae]MBF5041805.1 hypothetical protein [Simulacricoccus sp. 17bor-14]MRI87586.1 hypothetical protein [Aggregicoccus sp. 17bor-14]